jgi:hypothetical protein
VIREGRRLLRRKELGLLVRGRVALETRSRSGSAAWAAPFAAMRTHACALCVLLLATLSSAGAAGKDSKLRTSVAHVPAVKAAVQGLASQGSAHTMAPVKTKAKQASLAVASLQKKDGAAHSELRASLAQQASISKRFKSVHDKQLAKIRLGEKALIGTYATPSAKSVHDSLEWLPFVLPPLGLLLLGGVAFGVVTIRKQQKIPNMPTQGRLDIKDVVASAQQMKGGSKQMPNVV